MRLQQHQAVMQLLVHGLRRPRHGEGEGKQHGSGRLSVVSRNSPEISRRIGESVPSADLILPNCYQIITKSFQEIGAIFLCVILCLQTRGRLEEVCKRSLTFCTIIIIHLAMLWHTGGQRTARPCPVVTIRQFFFSRTLFIHYKGRLKRRATLNKLFAYEQNRDTGIQEIPSR